MIGILFDLVLSQKILIILESILSFRQITPLIEALDSDSKNGRRLGTVITYLRGSSVGPVF